MYKKLFIENQMLSFIFLFTRFSFFSKMNSVYITHISDIVHTDI